VDRLERAHLAAHVAYEQTTRIGGKRKTIALNYVKRQARIPDQQQQVLSALYR
jgi:hypothetical protein